MQADQAKEMLEQFIQIEKFGAQRQFPGQFGPPRGVKPQGQFEGRGGFPLEGQTVPPGFRSEGFPGSGQIPPEFQKEFEERFKQFDQYRQFFEQGGHGQFIPGGEQGAPPPGYRQGQEKGEGHPEGFYPQEGGKFVPPQEGIPFGNFPQHEGGFIPPTGSGITPQELQQFQQQFQNQFQQEHNQQYPSGGTYPPPGGSYPTTDGTLYPSSKGTYPPPDGSYQQPTGSYPTSGNSYQEGLYQQPPPDGTNQYAPPPSGETQYQQQTTPPPESTAPPPTSIRPSLRSLLGTLFAPLLELLR